MRVRVGVLVSLALIVASLHAEEPPHFRFAQGLRDRQMSDLALQYLEALQARKLPADVAAVLPLEMAKSRLGLAVLETDAGRRAALQDQARTELRGFLEKNPRHPLAADANLELARVGVLQGRAQLSRARRAEGREARDAEMRKARGLFEQAAGQLEAAAKQIDTQLAQLAEAQTPEGQAQKEALAHARLQAEFELGLNLYDQAQTYTDERDLLRRGLILKKAVATLDKASHREPKNPTCSLARAWLGRCQLENDNPQEAARVFAEVIAEPGEHADAARRLARYFRLLVLAREQGKRDNLVQIQKGAEGWLAEYRNYLNTPEGSGVRYELAEALLAQALATPKTQQPKARDLYVRAQRLFQALEAADSDFSESAREKKLNIILTLSEERSRGDVTKLRDFEECYLRAQFEVAKLNRAEKELKDERLDKQRDEHVRNIIQALTRGLDLADAKVPAQDLGDARYLLARAYFTREDYYRTAVLGEDLARTQPQARRAPQAATYALYAYAQFVTADERAGAGPEVLDADRTRLRKLAEYVERTWPTAEAADVARHQLGSVYWGEKKYPEAVAVLGRVTQGYPNLTHALYLLALAALQAEKAGTAPPAGKPTYAQLAQAALQAVPEPTGGTPPGTVLTYLEAKLQLGGLLYTAQKFPALQALADTLRKQLAAPELGLDESTRAALRPRVHALELLARFGQGEADYRAGQYAKVCAALEPVVNELRNPATRGPLTEIKPPGLLHGLLGLALRANVQDGKIDRAKDILDLLQATAPENSLDILRDLVRQLNGQVQELRQKGESAKDQLDRTVESFSVFLDVLAKQPTQDKPLPPELTLFLAESYASLDKHDVAAELLKQVPEPQPKADTKEPDPKAVQVYRAARILTVRELRLAQKFKEAQAALDEILGTPAQPRWGQRSYEVRKERVFLLEDQGKFGAASREWSEMMRPMRPLISQNAKLREEYFETYFHLTNCLYKYAQTLGDPVKRRKALSQAANFIVQLERTQPDLGGEASKQRFDELLRKEAPLKEQYEELKKTTK
jgi:TolA-binding protein